MFPSLPSQCYPTGPAQEVQWLPTSRESEIKTGTTNNTQELATGKTLWSWEVTLTQRANVPLTKHSAPSWQSCLPWVHSQHHCLPSQVALRDRINLALQPCSKTSFHSSSGVKRKSSSDVPKGPQQDFITSYHSVTYFFFLKQGPCASEAGLEFTV